MEQSNTSQNKSNTHYMNALGLHAFYNNSIPYHIIEKPFIGDLFTLRPILIMIATLFTGTKQPVILSSSMISVHILDSFMIHATRSNKYITISVTGNILPEYLKLIQTITDPDFNEIIILSRNCSKLYIDNLSKDYPEMSIKLKSLVV